MKIQEIKERVAAGIRNMNYPPSALLCTSGIIDTPYKIAGIPILISAFLYNTYSDNNIPFIPVWDDFNIDYPCYKERKLFESGYLGEY